MENGLRLNMFLYRLTNFICLSVVGFTKHEGPGMLFCLQGSEMRLWNPIQAISPKEEPKRKKRTRKKERSTEGKRRLQPSWLEMKAVCSSQVDPRGFSIFVTQSRLLWGFS